MKHFVVASVFFLWLSTNASAGWFLPERATVKFPLSLIEQWSKEYMVVTFDSLIDWKIELLKIIGGGCATIKNKKKPFETMVFLPTLFVRLATLCLTNNMDQVMKIEFVPTAAGLHIRATPVKENDEGFREIGHE